MENSDGDTLLDIVKKKKYQGFDVEEYDESDMGYEGIDQKQAEELGDTVIKFNNEPTLILTTNVS